VTSQIVCVSNVLLLIFLANFFYSDGNSVGSGTAVYQGTVNATTLVPVLNTDTNSMNFIKRINDPTAILDRFDFGAQNDRRTLVSLDQYLPVQANYTFNFDNITMIPGIPAVRFRVTFFKERFPQIQSTAKDFSLPAQAGALWHMCEDDPVKRNFFSKVHHHIIADKYILIKSPVGHLATANSPAEVKNISRSLRFNIKFPPKPVTPMFGGQANVQETPWTNIPITDRVWCLISCNLPRASIISPNIDITRAVYWRDRRQMMAP